MKLLQVDYQKLVIGTFRKMQREKKVPRLLDDLSRANLRQECLNVYDKKIQNGEPEETETLTAFFGVPNRGSFRMLIADSRADKFRPLESLLNNRVQHPNHVNFELLAWLIDFQPRPFVRDKQVFLSDDQLAMLNGGKIVSPKTEPIGDPIPLTPRSTGTLFTKILSNLKALSGRYIFRKEIAFGLGLLAVVMGAYFTLPANRSINYNNSYQLTTAHPSTIDSQSVYSDSTTLVPERKQKLVSPNPKTLPRCQAITRELTQYTRSTKEGDLCWQHAKMAHEKQILLIDGSRFSY